MEKLDPKSIENIFALTPLQEGMLFHYLRSPHSGLYFEQLSLEISGAIDIQVFQKTWHIIIETNEMLRTVFRWERLEKPSQIILKEPPFELRFHDLSDMGNDRKKTALAEMKTKDREEGFDLNRVPFRVTLCKLDECQYEMIISNHHILYDGWSNGIILKEFFKIYQTLFKKEQVRKFPAKPSFKEYIKWLQNLDRNTQEQYWRGYLSGLETLTELPIKKRAEEKTGPGDYSIILEEDINGKLNVFVKNNKVTLASVFYTAWGILLQKYCDSGDVIFGTTVSGRSGGISGIKGIEDMVGLFINTIPLRIQAAPNEKIIEVVFRTDQVLREQEKFENTPLVDIRTYSTVDGTGSLFDTILAIENYPLDNRLLPENSLLAVNSYSIAEMTHYDLAVGIMPFHEIEIKFSFKQELFDKETIENLAGHFKRIIQNIIENPETRLSQLEIISTEEKNRILYEFNNTAAEYPADKTIHQLFEEQAAKTPAQIALVGHIGLASPVRLVQLTYRQLNEQSNRVAGLLIEKGVLADNVVAIMMERSIEMIIGIFGILKSGGAYLPIDPDYPQERKQYMIKDSAAKILLTANEIASLSRECVFNSHHSLFINHHSYLSYLIYTSGSTGKPKGVMIRHRSVANLLYAMQSQYPFTGADVYLLKTSYTFDVSVTELFGWYLGGGKLAILEKNGERDPDVISDWIHRHHITHINFVPSMFSEFVSQLDSKNINRLSGLKYIFLAGEALLPEFVNKFRELNTSIRLENIYGPTESSVYSSKYSLAGWNGSGNIPIGRPMPNIRLYIFDKYDHLQPPGIVGELSIAGIGVARGYLNRPELTAEKFRPLMTLMPQMTLMKNKYNALRADFQHSAFINQHSNLYCTGDLARWLPDGNIQFLGRIDNQVKIRGFRIELGEIENRLLKHNRVKTAAVIVTDGNIPHLRAYIVLKNEEPGAIKKNPGAAEFREYLSQRLPVYMIPAHFFLVEKIPLTPHGKVDSKALQAANTLLGPGVEYVSPKSDIEKTIADIWKNLLGLDKVGIHDNFFDLGGNSLTIIRLTSRLKMALPDKKDISVVTLFNHPTIASLVHYLNREEKETVNPVAVKKIESSFERRQVEIAVIGMAGRFPGAKDIGEFWNNIKNGVESIRFFTQEELKQLGIDAELINNPGYVPAKGVLENKEYFDSFFFGYTPAEAEIMDPQVRMFHECTWEALENAGYDPFRYAGAVGLYAGASPNPLWEISPLTSGRAGSYPEIWNAFQFSDKDYLCSRIAYKLDLKGPSVTVQTACSTSLVAVDHACRALVSGVCTIALAGGVSITFQDEGGYLYQEGTIMSPDGHCRAFDAGAKGTVGGNGVGVVVLKRLAEAETDGDSIYAVIKGFGINNDGGNKVGFTAPSSDGQSKAIRDALDMAEINPESIHYVEAHGTGTLLGDPIEIEGLKLAFNAAGARKKHYCAIGSVKTNIGHLDAAAGIAGLIKTVLSLQHRLIPPSLNFKNPNPQIDFENSPFYVNTVLKEWKNSEHPLRAGVSSFGLGGTNVHVILEEYTSGGQKPFCKKVSGLPKTFDYLILLSAKTQNALDKLTANLTHHFEQNPGIDLANAAYTLQTGRKAFTHRKMLVCSDTLEAIHKLKANETETATAKEGKHTVIFMFSGQGSQYVNMGLDLYQNEPVFRRHIDECFALLKNITGIDMKPVLYPDDRKKTEAEEKISQFRYTTPIKFIFEYSLATMLMAWGIQPDAMIGHSFGEYVAACLSGVFSLEDGLFLATLRGELMHGLPDGTMLGVPLSEEELKQRLQQENELCTAAVNGESLCVVSGPVEAVKRFEDRLNREGYECLKFNVPKAGHSRMVEPIMAEFKKKIGKVKFNKPQIPFISCVSGKWITAEDAMDPAYWTRHLREPVRFAAGLTTLFKEPEPVFLQTSPGKGLILFVTQHPDRKEDTLALSMVKHRNEQVPDVYHTLTQIGRLWLNGFPIDWRKFYPHQKPHRIALPTYPFESKHYPLPKDLLKIGNREESEERSTNKFKLIRQTDMANWFYIPVWEESPLLSPTNRLPGFFNWLVFMDELGIGVRLVNELRGIARDVVTVTMGEAYVKINENSYSLSPGQPGDYGRLFHELHKSAKIPHNIVHLWSVSENKVSRMCGESLEEFDRAQELGFFSLLNIARAVGEENIPGEIHINVVSNNIQSVTGEEEIHPEKACMRGAVKIIPLEYDNIYCALIDFLLTGPGDTGNDERVRQLMRELTTTGETGGPDKMIALRGRRRWCERMKPVNLGNMGQGQVEQRLKEKGVYLITGGFGGMGFTIAGYLAQFFQAKVILIGRSFFPDRENWAEWLEFHPGDDAISKKIQKIQQWEEAGAEIMVHRADVADLERMISVIKDVHMRFGPINGVLHTAGLGDYAGLIRDRTHRMTKEVMAPKVKGAWVLDKVLAEDRLDFLVLFSSIGNIIYRVKFAQVGYNAANEYLEAFANYKTRKDGTYTVTINWCDWLEVGMSIEATNQKYQKRWEYKTRGGIGAIDYKAAIHGGITPAQGVEILTRIVNNPFSLERVTVSMYELDGMTQALRILGEKDSTPFAEIEKLVAPGKRQPRPPLSVPYVSPASPLEHSLSAIWSNYFGIEPIGVEDDFFELGGDSLKAMLMIQKIHKELGVRIPLAEFFKNPTVKGQAGYIARSEKKIYDSIPLVEKKEYYPQSSAQRRIYVIHRMEENSIRYNITHAVTIEGEIDESRFQGIFARIIKRHESLRTSFLMINDEAVQIVHEEAEFEIGYYTDYTDFQKSSFNLSHAPLLRVALLKIAEKKHLLLLDIHHIIADGASIDILQDEIISIYNGEELLPLPVNYKDYAGWQSREKNSERIHEQGKYWQEVFAGEIPFLNLPTDYKRPVLQSFDGSRLNFEISIDMMAKLKTLALATGATMYMVVLAVYTIFLAKISGQDDIVIGTPASGRSHTDLEKIIGMFVNTLTLRNYPSGEKEFLHYLSEIKDSTVKAFENQDYQYEDLVDQVVKDRDISRNPLFDTMFVMQQNTVVRQPDIPGLKIKPYEHENTTSKFDLTLEGREENERLSFWFEYSTKLFKPETIGRFIAYFINIIKRVVENSREKISDFEIITEAEKKLVLFDFNDTGIAYPMGKTIHQLFEEQVEQTPDHIALVGADLRVCPSRNACNVGNVNLTYRQLNEQSDRLAGLFIEKGILPDNIIGIMMERSVEMIIGIMGILKSGGAYLPIDPEFPKDRIDYMLKDSNAAILLTDNCQLTIVNSQLSMSEHRASFHHSNMAYVIYTSGSTGNPKGVMIDHASVVNLLFVMQDNYPFTSSDTYLVKTSYVFDVSVTELFGWFMGGGRAAVLEKDGHKDPRAIVDSIERNKVSYINFVPSMFNSFIGYMAGEKKRRLAGLKYIFLAGEELLPGLVEKFRDLNTGITLENIYGPTESTVYSCKYSLSGWNGIGDIPIGQPLANTKLYILNKYHYLQPVGIAGELCISGPGLARGYLNNPELTADRFYRSYRSYMTYIFYKTGDLARWQPDGNIEFLGRVDHQVKIRGFRIELGEIENRLLNYPGIKEAAVLAHEEETGDKYLCAYFVSVREHERSELQEYLSMALPEYMIPAYFMPLEKIPLTPSGKIDRRALPKPGLKAGKSYIAPRNEIERKLVGIWSEVLGRDALQVSQLQTSIGIHDNFFQSGGHSLKATLLVSKIHKVFNVKIPLVEIFKNPTISGLSNYIVNTAAEAYTGIAPVEQKEYYVLSSAERRLHFLQEMDKDGTAYNIPVAWILEGVLDRKKLADTFVQLVKRHESFRTSFIIIGEEPVRRVHNKSFAELFQKRPLGEDPLKFIQPFDLSQAPLLRVGLINLAEDRHMLLVDMHHIISDGMSSQVLARDFSALYAGNELPGIKVQYKDYAEWQKRERVSKNILEQGEFWEKEFEGEIPVLELPADYARPAVYSFEGNKINFEINKETAGALKSLALETGTTLYMLLLALYTIFLSKLSSREDIVVGTPVAGRRHDDLEKIIGMFVNTLATRNYPAGEKMFRDFLAEVKEKTLKAFENQEYPYEDLVEKVTAIRDVSRNPLFDTMFVLQNTGSQEIAIPGLKLVPYEFENKTSKFALSLTGVEVEEKLQLTFEYSTKLFKGETIERFIDYFINIIRGVVSNSRQKIADFEIITEAEKNRILYDFNDTETAYPKDKTIHQLFEEQVEKAPDRIALSGEPVGHVVPVKPVRPVNLTYRQLNEQSGRVAGCLIEKGVLPDNIVAIMMERSVEMIIGIMGILKSGGAYLPIDPEYPQERIDYMLKDSGATILLTNLSEGRRNNCQLLIVNCELLMGAPQALFHHSSFIIHHSNHLAYIIYTSGSTGKPKGVLTVHRNVTRVVKNTNYIDLTSRDRILQLSNYAFDGSAFDIYGALLNSAALILIEKETVSAANRLAEAILREQITVFFVTTALFNVLVELEKESLKNTRKILFGGERVSLEHTGKALEYLGKGKIIHVYGPTETTVYASYYFIDEIAVDAPTIPIGKPLSNTTIYIVDKNMNPLPCGIGGEIFIGGKGTARGYLNNPELTNEKFKSKNEKLKSKNGSGALRADFHHSSFSIQHSILYCTGDLARWLPDGNVEFLGRLDHQVKIRGFRVEPGEIESRLSNYPGMKKAVVVVREEDSGDKYICAYVVSNLENVIPKLREFLAGKLPEYMIPSYFVRLDEIPLTPNGKVDRKALPKPELNVGESYTAPRNEIEKKLVEIWSNILGRDPLHASQLQTSIGIDDNFFHLGGHSLKATILAAKIHKEFDVKVPLAEIFKTPGIRELAEYIQRKSKEFYISIEPTEEKEYYELSPAQKRLYILQQLVADNTSYNMPFVIPLDDSAEKEKLETVFKKLIERHESLRTSFITVNKKPVQRIHREIDFSIGSYEATEEADVNSFIPGFTKPFNLDTAPLLRVNLISVGASPGVRRFLFIDMHHIITDGTSQSILEKEFRALLEGEAPQPLRFQYKDYSEWYNRVLRQEMITRQESYWLGEFSGELPVLDLPTDYPRPSIQGVEGNVVSFSFNARETGVLKAIAKQHEITLFMALLAIFNILLAKLSGQEDIIIGTPIAARRHADLENVIGMLVNTLAIRNFPLGDKVLKEFLRELRVRTLDAYENQEYPFEVLVDKIAVNRDTGRNPVFDVMLNLLNQDDYRGEISVGDEQSFYHNKSTSRFDIAFSVVDMGDKINFTIEYSTRLYNPGTVERFIRYLEHIVISLPGNIDKKLSDIDYIPVEEKEKILDLSQGVSESPDKIELTIHRLFEEKSRECPDKIALVFEGSHLSYEELNRRANRLARFLRKRGVASDTVVGVMIERSFEMVIAIMAILKAGGAYMPVVPEYPPQRILTMLNDSRVSLLLTHGKLLDRFSITHLKDIRTGKSGDGLTITPSRAQIKDFDRIPIPDRTLIDYKKYHQYIGEAPLKHSITLQATRGCPFNCIYCHKIWPKTHVARSAENIFKEISYAYDAGVRRFVFIDDIFNLHQTNAARFLETVIKSKMDIQLSFPNGFRADILSKEFIDLLMAAGTVNIDVALESASRRIQKLTRKNLDLDKFKENVQYIAQKYPHVILEMEMMLGFPTETEAEALMTLDFLKEIKWVHFPNLHILKIFPNTDMYRLAIKNGISEKSIHRSTQLAYHELPETLPFPGSFTRQFQARFMGEYFLSRERLLHVLPQQMKVLSEDELIQKYDSYLTSEIKSFNDILQYVGISRPELGDVQLRQDQYEVPRFTERIRRYFPMHEPTGDAFRVLLLDLSQLFSDVHEQQLHHQIEAPLGLMFLATYLADRFKGGIHVRICKSRIDFDNYPELQRIILEFKPQLIGIRTLSYYKEFFHRSVMMIRRWEADVPIITGGPYATSDFQLILQDRDVDLVVLGEGEHTLGELVEKMMANNGKLPGEEVLEGIHGIAFVKDMARRRSREIVSLEEILHQCSRFDHHNLRHGDGSSDLLYVIYTSGSTGTPKGVMLQQQNLVNLIDYQYTHTNIDFSRVLQFTTIGFDVSAQEIFSTLLAGGRLVLIAKDTLSDIPALLNIVEKNNIRTLFLPASFLKFMSGEENYIRLLPSCIKHIITAGEQVIINDGFKKFLQRNNVYFHNHYGPSETHVVTALTLKPGDGIPALPSIGRPVSNTGIYLLDKVLQLVPAGVAGELFITGYQVGRGYLNNPELTAEKFKINRSYGSYRTYFFYKTGDLARWLTDGNIEFLGRIDHQVKIRGFRVELGEIENRLLNYPGIKEAVVVVREGDNGDKYICAYVVSDVENAIPGLRDSLSKELPEYMIPSYFVPLEKIPLTPSGKIDRRALHKPGLKADDTSTAPRDEIEERLAKLWAEALELGKTRIGIDANFFELGGHSLRATILIAKIHKDFQTKIPLSELFKAPRIREMAEYIRNTVKERPISIDPVEEKEYYECSFAQKRLYIESLVQTGSTAYNMPIIMELAGNLDYAKLENAFLSLIRRHENLRTSFDVVEDHAVQKVHRFEDISFSIERAAETIEDFIKPFDLSRAPVFRVGLIKKEEKRHILMVDMHHIISDGISLKTLAGEFMALYDGNELPSLRIQYKDFSEWQNRLFRSQEIEKQKKYWLSVFEGGVPALNIPTDYRRQQRSFEGRVVAYEIDHQMTTAVRQLVSETGITLHMVLLAVFSILMSKYGGQEDIVVGSGVSGRRHADLENVIGMFVNLIPMRNYPKKDLSFREFLEKVKTNALNAYENQDYPFDELVKDLNLQGKPGTNPLFDVVFQTQNVDIPGLKVGDLTVQPIKSERNISHFDLILTAFENTETIITKINYSPDLYKTSTAEEIGKNYLEILRQAVDNRDIRIQDIGITIHLVEASTSVLKEKIGDFDFR